MLARKHSKHKPKDGEKDRAVVLYDYSTKVYVVQDDHYIQDNKYGKIRC